MKNFKQIAAALAITLILPASALAHDGKDNKSGKSFFNFKGGIHWHIANPYTGSVTAVSSTGFTLVTSDNKTFSVVTTNATISQAFGSKLQLSDIKVNDKAYVKGTVDGGQITAKSVLITPANTHPAAARGTVTAVNGNTVTVQTNNFGVPSTVTVKTDANTTVTQNGSTTTPASIQVGSKIKVKGLWDEILNVLNAIKVKIKA